MNNGTGASNPIISVAGIVTQEGQTGQEKGGEEKRWLWTAVTYSTMIFQRLRTEEKSRASERRRDTVDKWKLKS